MRTLYLECNMGAAGDMLTAALLELVPDPDAFIDQLNHLELPGVSVKAVPSEKCGITGTHMVVTVEGEEEHSLDVHDHEEQHGHYDHFEQSFDKDHSEQVSHHHHHTSLSDVNHLIDRMPLDDAVKLDIRNVYQKIAEAEGHAHGMPVDQIHFHEVGTMDAILDVTAVCLLMHELHPEQVIASPVRTGFGEVRCAHGIMPVPAPATAYLLQGIPTYAGGIEGEMCTPTGAALLTYYAKSFEQRPVMSVEKVGYGMGSKDFPTANCVRAFLGDSAGGIEETESDDLRATEDRGSDHIIELRCNIDDMTGEEMGYAVSKLLDAGARDVFTTPIAMKKNRPGILLTVICSPEDKEEMARAIFRYTTTIGIRETLCSRYILNRTEETQHTPAGDIRMKISSGYGVTRVKPEYEDLVCAAEASGKTLMDMESEVSKLNRKE